MTITILIYCVITALLTLGTTLAVPYVKRKITRAKRLNNIRFERKVRDEVINFLTALKK